MIVFPGKREDPGGGYCRMGLNQSQGEMYISPRKAALSVATQLGPIGDMR